MRIDCHNHANYSPDASQTLEELAETAVRAGVGYLAVTEPVAFDIHINKLNA